MFLSLFMLSKAQMVDLNMNDGTYVSASHALCPSPLQLRSSCLLSYLISDIIWHFSLIHLKSERHLSWIDCVQDFPHGISQFSSIHDIECVIYLLGVVRAQIYVHCMVPRCSVAFLTHPEIIPVGQFFRRWILRRRSFLVDWLIDDKLTLTWLVYWIRTARSVFTGAGLRWPNTAGQDSTCDPNTAFLHFRRCRFSLRSVFHNFLITTRINGRKTTIWLWYIP